jgi:pimeloyl-ACP methyl ester carboxylesterase
MSSQYHIFGLSQRGRGDSDWAPDGQYTGAAFVADLEGFIDGLGLDNFVLMGHSMGGRNSMLYAGTHPEKVRKLILVDIGPEGDPRGGARIRNEMINAKEEFDSFEQVMEAQKKSNPLCPEDVLRRRTTYQTKVLPNGKIGWRYDLEVRQQWREDRRPAAEDLWPYIAKIPCPTLVVRGAETDILPMSVAERMTQVMAQAEVVEVERAAHMVMEENPPGFTQAVRDFLARNA